MFEVIISARDTDDFSFGFGRDRNRRQRELTENKYQKSKYHLTTLLKNVFGFSEHQKTTNI